MKKVLIPASIPELFRDDFDNVLLGPWCASASETGQKNIITAPPYFLDSDARTVAISEVDVIYGELLRELTSKLNEFHGLELSQRFWEIMTGHWLHRLCTQVYCLWHHLLELNSAFPELSFQELDITGLSFTPFDYYDFYVISRSELWQYWLAQEVCKAQFKVHFSIRSDSDGLVRRRLASLELDKEQQIAKFGLKKKLFCFFLPFLFAMNKQDYFLHGSCMSLRDHLMTYARLGCIPRYDPELNRRPQKIPKRSQRPFKLSADDGNPLVTLVKKIVCEQIPLVYAEAYPFLKTDTLRFNWPRSPKVIYTANSFQSNEHFKFWVANSVERGGKYIIGQHGGNYGTAEYAPSETIEKSISDAFLVWGWAEDYENNIPSIFKKHPMRHKSDGGAIIVLRPQGTREYPWDDYVIYEKYLDHLAYIYYELKKDIAGQLEFKTWSSKIQPDQVDKNRLKKRINEIKFSASEKLDDVVYSRFRVAIHTYHSTTILECMARNYPSVIFFDPSLFSIRKEAIQDFEELKLVSLFHDTPASLVYFLNHNWHSLNVWWSSSRVQKARKNFVQKYALTDGSLSAQLAKKMKAISKSNI